MADQLLNDLRAIERSPHSPQSLCDDVWTVLSHSISAKANVEVCDRETGRYRVVLQGTLEHVEPETGTGI